MFDKTRNRFASFISSDPMAFVGPSTKGYIGSDAAYDLEVLSPLVDGGKKNVYSNSDAEKIGTVMTCIRILSDSISRLPLNIYQATGEGNQVMRDDYRYDLLHYSPDGIVTSNSFFSALEYQRNLRGNSFARIIRDRTTGRAKSLQFITSNAVGGYKMSRGKLFYIVYEQNGNETKKIAVNANDMLHFKMLTKNSLWGVSPIEAQRLTLSTLWKSTNTVNNYYENNAFSPKVLKSLIPDAQFQKQFAEAMKSFKTNNVGVANAGKIIKLPPFTEIQELSLNPVDKAFVGGQEFSVSQIASFFGIPPEMVGVITSSKFNNVEQGALNFRVNTMAPIIRMYRMEMEHKLLTAEERKAGKSIEFVIQALLETDLTTKSAYYKSLFDLGVMTSNQIALLEGLPTYTDGDKHYLSSQTTAIEDRNNIVDPSVNK